MSNIDVEFGSIILDTDSDDCEEIDAEEEDGDDYVVSKKRNEAKKPRSKSPKVILLCILSYILSWRALGLCTKTAFKSTIHIRMCTYVNNCITMYIPCRHIYYATVNIS